MLIAWYIILLMNFKQKFKLSWQFSINPRWRRCLPCVILSRYIFYEKNLKRRVAVNKRSKKPWRSPEYHRLTAVSDPTGKWLKWPKKWTDIATNLNFPNSKVQNSVKITKSYPKTNFTWIFLWWICIPNFISV